jgi:type I restriction enzyme M protein
VLPDNVLFESGVGAEIRRDLMNKCNLHTILRLPTGIFYAQGVKTNVLFFSKVSEAATDSTKQVWVYDLRANAPKFGKRTPLTREYFDEFERAYGENVDGTSARLDEGEHGRFRCFSRDFLRSRADSLDISWLKDDSDSDVQNMAEPWLLAQEIVGELEAALDEIRLIAGELRAGSEE